MMQEFYDKFHPTERCRSKCRRESGERILGKDPKQSRFCSFRNLVQWPKLVKRMMKRKICQFNGRSKYWNYYIGRSIESFLLPKDLGNIKEEVQVSNGRYGPYIRHGAAFV
jgi:DNA topoisomerase-1